MRQARRIPYVEGLALLAILLLILFAIKGTVSGKATADVPCKDGARLASCLSDSSGSHLVEMSCQRGRWREQTTKCDCQALPSGAACV